MTIGEVVKTYDGPDAGLRRAAEFAFFTAFRDILPVPRVLSTMDEEQLRTAFVPGRVGTDAIGDGHAGWVFPAAGALLHTLSRAEVPALAGTGPIVMHGDFGPQNLLIDEDQRIITAVLDAEWSRRGPEELRHSDAAWFEWIIRYHHPQLTPLLQDFYAAYGGLPPWPHRHRLMLLRCEEILDFAVRREAGAQDWRERIVATGEFGESW